MLLHHADEHENDDPETQHDDFTGTLGIKSVYYCHQLTTLLIYCPPKSCLIDCQAMDGQTSATLYYH